MSFIFVCRSPSKLSSPGMTLMSMSWGTEEKEISRPQMEEVSPGCTSASQLLPLGES